ncbi:hypothetical protein B0H11DRAFT_2222118 [Mycena galericulata]|nr:hypothetical protein B0H11DRAFT_2222118 [Mycena galericulata]
MTVSQFMYAPGLQLEELERYLPVLQQLVIVQDRTWGTTGPFVDFHYNLDDFVIAISSLPALRELIIFTTFHLDKARTFRRAFDRHCTARQLRRLVQMKLVDYKELEAQKTANGQEGFWDDIDKQLADRRETALTIPVANRAAFSSFIFEEALKLHLSLCPPRTKRKSSTRLPKWQENISRAIEEMESYTQEELAEEEVPEDDGDFPASPA